MNANPNIYDAIVFDLHPKMREFLDLLDQTGQIDRDETNTPHVVSIEPNGSVHRCVFMRNGRVENVILHTRKKADPVRSWRDDDGYARQERKADDAPSRKERDRRPMRVWENIVEQILPTRRPRHVPSRV